MSSQVGRVIVSPRSREELTVVDIVALETFERLMDKGLDREDIDRSRILPLHSDVIVDLDILRDLPPFPTASTDATGSTSRAKAWQGILPVAAESFVDDPERLHLDAQARLCPRRDCRTFGCQLHSKSRKVWSGSPKLS